MRRAGTLIAAKSTHSARGGASGSRRRWTSEARAMSRRSVSCSTTRPVSRAFSIINAN
jgi:hypothetical protein